MTQPAHIIVIGNEKGGSGKSTTAMHLIVGLMQAGKKVGSLDLDIRQGSLTKYVTNRRNYLEKRGLDLPLPDHRSDRHDDSMDIAEARIQEINWFQENLEELREACDVVVIDTPGNDTALNRLGHSFADTLITPLNDSFIDLDVLARVNTETMEIEGPSHYAELIWQQRMKRQQTGAKATDWIVMRNRLSHLDAHNKRQMEELLAKLAKRIGFRILPGFGERVIYRELFLNGLTMMDFRDLPGLGDLSMSHIAARQEVRTLIDALDV